MSEGYDNNRSFAFFVLFYIMFNLCVTNVIVSLAIECFGFLKSNDHENEGEGDSLAKGS